MRTILALVVVALVGTNSAHALDYWGKNVWGIGKYGPAGVIEERVVAYNEMMGQFSDRGADALKALNPTLVGFKAYVSSLNVGNSGNAQDDYSPEAYLVLKGPVTEVDSLGITTFSGIRSVVSSKLEVSYKQVVGSVASPTSRSSLQYITASLLASAGKGQLAADDELQVAFCLVEDGMVSDRVVRCNLESLATVLKTVGAGKSMNVEIVHPNTKESATIEVSSY